MVDVFDVVMVILAITLAVFICFICVFAVIDDNQSRCAYCCSEISDSADYICMTDGRRFHAECYMREREEGYNGKAND